MTQPVIYILKIVWIPVYTLRHGIYCDGGWNPRHFQAKKKEKKKRKEEAWWILHPVKLDLAGSIQWTTYVQVEGTRLTLHVPQELKPLRSDCKNALIYLWRGPMGYKRSLGESKTREKEKQYKCILSSLVTTMGNCSWIPPGPSKGMCIMYISTSYVNSRRWGYIFTFSSIEQWLTRDTFISPCY